MSGSAAENFEKRSDQVLRIPENERLIHWEFLKKDRIRF
jgi:hypothetical protein